MPADSQGNKDGALLSVYNGVRAARPKQKFAFSGNIGNKKGAWKAGTHWGLSLYNLTVILYTVSAQT